MRHATFLIILLLAGLITVHAQHGPEPLAFDAIHKQVSVRAGQTNAVVTFLVTNRSSIPVVVRDVVPSCGCSEASFPAKPWSLAPGGRGVITITTDVRGKTGSLLKTVYVHTATGLPSQLTYQVDIVAPASPEDRARNQQLAKTDRQAVFRGDCARCHADPTRGKVGRELYAAACGICHDAEHRASMVPDLKSLKRPLSGDYWLQRIAFGKHGTLMPAFAERSGGPLTDAQIHSLVEFLR